MHQPETVSFPGYNLRNTCIGAPQPVSVRAGASLQFPKVNRSRVPSLNIYYAPSARDKPQHARLQRLMGLHHMGLHIARIHLAWRCVVFFPRVFVLFSMKCIDVSALQTSPLSSLTRPILQTNREREEKRREMK